MAGESSSRKWMILVATIWIQAFTGTNLDFSSYSTDLKSVLGISQVQLNYISIASDVGKAFGWCSGVCLMYFPTWIVIFIAALMGLIGYGLQCLLIHHIISLPYFLVLVSSLMAGCSICWFNTVCYVLCIKSFPSNRGLALSISISFNGVSAAIYNLIANSINPNDNKLYLLLNALVPLIISVVSLPLIIRHTSTDVLYHRPISPVNFLILTAVAVITGLYLLLLNSIASTASTAHLILSGAMLLLVLPVVIPRIIRLRESSSSVIDNDDLDIHKELMGTETSDFSDSDLNEDDSYIKDQLVVLGEEHSTRMLIRNWDFWLYYFTYFCGGTLGLVYSNNLGQISESLGYHSDIGSLVSQYSACSFFGRLFSSAPDFLRGKMHYARTGWLTLAIVPAPIAFILLVLSDSKTTLLAATGLIGLSSGFVFSAAVSITSELFGPNTAGVNHNILITNIPLGSLLYSVLAALIYEANIGNYNKVVSGDEPTVCMGRDCYRQTFVLWFWISLLGLSSSSLLSLRTVATYNRLEKPKQRTQTTVLKSFSSYEEK
ncbi:hypothetical protein ACS0TY_003354 [Phlomoides rotata]